MRLPAEFEARMKALLGDEFADFERAFDAPAVRALRVNTQKMSVEHFLSVCPFPVTPVPFCPQGFYFDFDGIGHHPLHHSGAIYVQEPAAMAVLECCEIVPGMKILDLCASPGGKTSQAAAKTGDRGILVSNEIVPDRCRVLLQNVERLGIRNAVVTNTDTATLSESLRDFDLVIVDAPCSGEGMMRKNQNAIDEWSTENVQMCAARQKEILNNAAKTVAPGGKLLYSTCTFAPEENELQIDDFIKSHPDFRLIPVSERVRAVTRDGVRFDGIETENIEFCRRFYPHVSPGEGQFMALLERSGDAEEAQSAPTVVQVLKKDRRSRHEQESNAKKDRSRGADPTLVRDFLSTVLEVDPTDGGKFTLEEKPDGFYLVPTLDLPSSAVFSAGVKIGTAEKGRLIPHHRFFMAFGSFFKIKIELCASDPRVLSFIHGDVIPVDAPAGFAAVMYEGATLGGGKISGGMLKNYYPKGLRE